MRTFIAIDLPDAVRRFLAARQDRLRAAGGSVRWVRPERMHLTLAFLGEVPEEMAPEVEAAVREACAGFAPVPIEMGGAGQFPPRGRPRVVWTGLEDPAGRLLALQAALARATEVFAEKPERRRYEPHLTLGRVRGGRGLRDLSGAVARLAGETGPQFTAREVVLFKSDLSPQGPTYTALARVALEG